MTGEGSHDFARVRRIVKTDEFSSVFRLRPTQKSAHFVLYTRPKPAAPCAAGRRRGQAFRAARRHPQYHQARHARTVPHHACRCRLHRAPGAPGEHQGRPGDQQRAEGLLHAELARLFLQVTKRQPPSARGGPAAAGAMNLMNRLLVWLLRAYQLMLSRCSGRTAVFIRAARTTRSKRSRPMARARQLAGRAPPLPLPSVERAASIRCPRTSNSHQPLAVATTP
jgi:ribonuclease P protein component